MKKVRLLSAILTCSMLCGCANNAAAPTVGETGSATEAVTEAPASETTAPITEAETSAAFTTSAETTAETTAETSATTAYPIDESRGETMPYYCWDNEVLPLYKDEAEEQDYSYWFPYAYGFLATGVYDDSIKSPERFDVEQFEYTPAEEYVRPDFIEFRAGQQYGDYVIKGAGSTLSRNEGYDSYLMMTTLMLEGEHTFEGRLYFAYEEDYATSAGELFFMPAVGLEGMPLLACCKPDWSISEVYSLYSELASGFRAGNYFTGSAGYFYNADSGKYEDTPLSDKVKGQLDEILGSESGSCSKHVRVTLSDISLEWSDNFGIAMHTKAAITNIEEIE